MSIWILLFIVLGAGAVGGTINALLSDNGFLLPRTDEYVGRRILRPGFLGNVLVGGIAAVISWGLYGPLAAAAIVGAPIAGTTVEPSLTLSALVGAALVGVAGARWLTNEVDKNLLRAAASEAGSGRDFAARLLTERPATAWQIAAEEARLQRQEAS